MNTVIQKYAAALLPFLLFVVGAIQAVLPGGIALDEAWQLAALVAGAIATFFVPLVDGAWSGILKVGAALVAALATAIIPFVIPGGVWDGTALLVVVIAVLNALATQLGVSIRLDATKAAIGTLGAPGVSGPAIPDGPAVEIVTGRHSASI